MSMPIFLASGNRMKRVMWDTRWTHADLETLHKQGESGDPTPDPSTVKPHSKMARKMSASPRSRFPSPRTLATCRAATAHLCVWRLGRPLILVGATTKAHARRRWSSLPSLATQTELSTRSFAKGVQSQPTSVLHLLHATRRH
jgi:hypothetical protein